MQGLIDDILKKLKEFIIPIIFGIITAPLLNITSFRGIILKKPYFSGEKKFIYPVYVTADNISGIEITFALNDTAHYSIGNYRMYLMPEPQNDTYVNSTHTSITQPSANTRGIRVSEVLKGKYHLTIPLVKKNTENHLSSEAPGSLRFDKEGNGFGAVRSSQFTDWFYFHPWLSALIIFSLLLAIKFILSKKKPER